MPAFNKEHFGQPMGLKQEQFACPELGEGNYVCLRALPAKDLVEFQAKYGPGGNPSDISFVFDVLWKCIVDEHGANLFQSIEEIATSQWSYDLLTKLVKKVLELSGLDKGAEKN